MHPGKQGVWAGLAGVRAAGIVLHVLVSPPPIQEEMEDAEGVEDAEDGGCGGEIVGVGRRCGHRSGISITPQKIWQTRSKKQTRPQIPPVPSPACVMRRKRGLPTPRPSLRRQPTTVLWRAESNRSTLSIASMASLASKRRALLQGRRSSSSGWFGFVVPRFRRPKHRPPDKRGLRTHMHEHRQTRWRQPERHHAVKSICAKKNSFDPVPPRPSRLSQKHANTGSPRPNWPSQTTPIFSPNIPRGFRYTHFRASVLVFAKLMDWANGDSITITNGDKI